MFEPKFAAERKLSFERDGLDASKACHICQVPSHLFERFRGLSPSAEPSCSFLPALSSGPALSSRAGLRQLVGLSDRSFADGGPCICALTCVHDVVPVFDLQDFLPVQPYLNKRLVLFWEPEAINFLILPYRVCERRLRRLELGRSDHFRRRSRDHSVSVR